MVKIPFIKFVLHIFKVGSWVLAQALWYFEFEKQLVNPLIFKSYSYEFLYFYSDEVVTKNYVPNTLWDLKNITNTWSLPYDRFQDFYEQYQMYVLKYEITLKRRPLYFIMNSIFPSLVLNLITVLSFALPFASQIALGKFIVLLTETWLNHTAKIQFIHSFQRHDNFSDLFDLLYQHVECHSCSEWLCPCDNGILHHVNSVHPCCIQLVHFRELPTHSILPASNSWMLHWLY